MVKEKVDKAIVEVGQKRGRKTTQDAPAKPTKAKSVDSGKFKRAASNVGKMAKASSALKHSKTTTEKRRK